MFAYYKDNFSQISKLFVNQLGMMIFGFVVAQATVSKGDEWCLAASLFALIFYLVLLYQATWDFGAKDRVRVDGGRLANRPFHGLMLGVAANIFNFLFILLFAVGALTGKVEGDFGTRLYAVMKFVLSIFQSMYLGIFRLICGDYEQKWIQVLMHTAGLIPPLAACFLGYRLGFKNIRIASFFGIKTKEAKKVETQEERIAKAMASTDLYNEDDEENGDDDQDRED